MLAAAGGFWLPTKTPSMGPHRIPEDKPDSPSHKKRHPGPEIRIVGLVSFSNAAALPSSNSDTNHPWLPLED